MRTMRAMNSRTTRRQAAELLLGRAEARLELFGDVPAALRSRTARRSAAELLGECAPLSALEGAALVRCATVDADPHVRVAALDALARAAQSALAIPILVAGLADSSEAVSRAARAALKRLDVSDDELAALPRAHARRALIPLAVPALLGH